MSDLRLLEILITYIGLPLGVLLAIVAFLAVPLFVKDKRYEKTNAPKGKSYNTFVPALSSVRRTRRQNLLPVSSGSVQKVPKKIMDVKPI